MIPFNVPHVVGKERQYITDAIETGHISGNGMFTKKCHTFFEEKFGFKKALLTSSCTDALEMCALLLDIQPGDEIIMPSYTFVSTANAFVLRGAKIVFCDSKPDHPGMDASKIEALITSKTKVIVPVHYAGVACDMDVIMDIANRRNIFVVEDAAQAINSYYKGKPLGSIGHLAAFSFHETKNIISGEGGLLAVNDERFVARSEIIWEKGTNRSAFWRGEVDKYGWVDVGSSFLPSELTAAFLWAQLEALRNIQDRRISIWNDYYKRLSAMRETRIKLPFVPEYASNNAHMFYLICESKTQRDALIVHLKSEEINAVFHYLSLHESPYYANKYKGGDLNQSNYYSECLVRLPFYYDLSDRDVQRISDSVRSFYSK